MTNDTTNTPAALQHHELFVEWLDDQQGPAVTLTQPSGGCQEPSSVLVHPWQLRAVCEQFGIIASDPQTAKTIATLTRRLLVLRDRIDHLGDYLTNRSDHDNANLDYELTYITATADIASEYCADLLVTMSPTDASPPQTAPVKTTATVSRM